MPPAFNNWAEFLYAIIGQPVVQSDTFWDIYHQLLQQFHIEEHAALVAPILAMYCNTVCVLELEAEMPLLPNLKDLQNGANVVRPPHVKYIGRMVNNPPVAGLRSGLNMELEEESDSEGGSDHGGIVESQYAEFTLDDDVKEDEEEGKDF